jgi:hypothetical protein
MYRETASGDALSSFINDRSIRKNDYRGFDSRNFFKRVRNDPNDSILHSQTTRDCQPSFLRSAARLRSLLLLPLSFGSQ